MSIWNSVFVEASNQLFFEPVSEEMLKKSTKDLGVMKSHPDPTWAVWYRRYEETVSEKLQWILKPSQKSSIFQKIQSRMKEKSWHWIPEKYRVKMQKAKVNPKTHKKYLEKKSIKNG